MRTAAIIIYFIIGMGVTAGIEKRLEKQFSTFDYVTSIAMWPATIAAFATYNLASIKKGGEA